MPKETFYRLPDEKRERIMAAAEREFLENSFEAASINRIIKEAAIPRGSFYQYFEDKKDIFLYIVSTHKNEAFGFVESFIKDSDGDVFSFMRKAIDFMIGAGKVDFSGVLKFAYFIAVTAIIAAIAQQLMTVCNNKITFGISRDMRRALFEKLHKLPLSYLDPQPSVDLLSRMI